MSAESRIDQDIEIVSNAPEGLLFRHVITKRDGLYVQSLHYPWPNMAAAAIGRPMFAREIITLSDHPIRNDVLLRPLMSISGDSDPRPNAPLEERFLVDQPEHTAQVYIGLSDLALQRELELVPLDEALLEVINNEEGIFHPWADKR